MSSRIKVGRYESEYVEEIADSIFKRLNPKLVPVEEHMVGMKPRLEMLKSIINIKEDDIRVVGIYGIGGIGKTTISKIVYNDILSQFSGGRFLEDVKSCHKDGLRLLQGLLHDIQGGVAHSEKFLIVMDDVDKWEQVDPLIRRCKEFPQGSRVIITSRDKGLLDKMRHGPFGIEVLLYEVNALSYEDAIQLFNWHTFKHDIPEEDYVNISNYIVESAHGHPLALKVLGSSLCGRTIAEWKSELDKLEKHPKKEISDLFRISIDGLDYFQREILLDIACFFKGTDKDFVETILDSCDLYAPCGMSDLLNRCLITVVHNKVQMHDLIQQTVWAMVREEYPKDPSKWSRLWDPNDIEEAFSAKKMKNIETISLDLSGSKEIQFTSEVFAKIKRMFAKMRKLRLLKVYYSHHHDVKDKIRLPIDFEFPPNLRYLHWEYLGFLPSNFDGKKLVAVNLKSSNIKKLWKEDQCLEKLKFINLSYSQHLMKIPKLASMPNLKRLNLEGCTSFYELQPSLDVFPTMNFLTELNFRGSGIKELPSSIGSLPCLEILNLSYCSMFEKFADIVFETMRHLRILDLSYSGIRELPSSIGYLESLEELKLRLCDKFEKFAADTLFENMGNLLSLDLSGTGIRELPSSIGYLESLEELNLRLCDKFEKFAADTIFENMGNLLSLDLSGSGIKELPSSIGYLESLEELNLRSCGKFDKFPEFHGSMRSLEFLCLDNTPIKELPIGIGCLEALVQLSVNGCSNLDKLPEFQRNMGRLTEIHANGAAIKELPNSICHLTALTNLFLNNSDVKELPCSTSHLTQLEILELQDCKNITSFPSIICKLKSFTEFSLYGCSNIKTLWEITDDVEHFEVLDLCGTSITELPSSIERWKSLTTLELSYCENLETLPNSIGNLTNLKYLLLKNCPKLQKLPDGLRGLNCCLKELDISGCNLMEGAIPSNVWGLFSLVKLNLSRNNNIRRIPAGIIHLSHLKTLRMSHCHKLKEIPELPSSLTRIEAHGCPCLETISSDSTHVFWSSLLNCFKSQMQNFGNNFNWSSFYMPDHEMINVVIPGSSCGGNGIPEWVSHRSIGSDQIVIELPKNWYNDDNFLGFALFSHHIPIPLGDDYSHDLLQCVEPIYLGSDCNEYEADSLEDWGDVRYAPNPALTVLYFPQRAIQREYRSNWWNTFQACFKGSYWCGDKTVFKVKSCGIHLIYRQHDPQPFNLKRIHHHSDVDNPLLHKRSRQV